MKKTNIFKITMNLTLICLVSGLLLGFVYIITAELKEENIKLSHENKIAELIVEAGFFKEDEKNKCLISSIYRYIFSDKDNEQYISYLLPILKENKVEYIYFITDVYYKKNYMKNYKCLDNIEASIRNEQVYNLSNELLNKDSKEINHDSFSFADKYLVILDNTSNNIKGYLLPSKKLGFKNIINMTIAINNDFSIAGLSIGENEEDPGLGKEIEKSYFKDQFKGKYIESLKVIKDPCTEDDKKKYIYAITGATISSRAVTQGVKLTLMNFSNRIIKIQDGISKLGLTPLF